MPISGFDLVVNRADLGDAEIVPATHPDTPPKGHVLLRIDMFSLTANNITYAVAPDSIGYWNFFPADRDGWGRVPVWGYAEVAASSHPQIAVGTRMYGYLPMSTHLMIEAGRVKQHGMIDAIAHRQPMAAIYNQYTFTDTDPGYAPEREAVISLFRPLFTTSFLLDDLHRSNACFGASTLLLSSASSKTALSLAYLMARDRPAGVRIVGLTSPGNMAFTKGLSIYDEVIAYDDLETLPRDKTAFVDMAGNADLLKRVHAHFDDVLMNSCRVGLTHWQNTANFVDGLSGGPKPYFFFAPTYAQDRIAEWGAGGFQERIGAAWSDFIAAADDWIEIRRDTGPEAVRALYLDMLQGRIDPAQGRILSMAQPS